MSWLWRMYLYPYSLAELFTKGSVIISFSIEELRYEAERDRRRLERTAARNAFKRRTLEQDIKEEIKMYPDIRSRPPPLSIKFGRVDCHPTISNRTTRNRFPRAEDGSRNTLEFFRRNFRFSTRETIAIMGKKCLYKFRVLEFAHQCQLEQRTYKHMIIYNTHTCTYTIPIQYNMHTYA